MYIVPNLNPPWSSINPISADMVYQTYQNRPSESITIELPLGRGGVNIELVRKVATSNGLSNICSQALLRMVRIQHEAQFLDDIINGESYDSMLIPTRDGNYKPKNQEVSNLLRKNQKAVDQLNADMEKLKNLYAEYRLIWYWMAHHCIFIKLGIKGQRIEMPHERINRK